MAKKVLVTGANGFCGRWLLPYLHQKGYEVFGTWRKEKPHFDFPVKLYRLDITSKRRVANLLKKIRPDAIVHLSAQSLPGPSWKDPLNSLKINVLGTLNVLDAMRKLPKPPKLLFSSSIQVYGRSFYKVRTVTEKTTALPESPYAISKLLAELACLNYTKKYGLNVCIARPFNHIGPGQSTKLVLSDWTRQVSQALNNKRIKHLCVGNINVERQFLHVEDVVSAYELLLRKGKKGEIYNVALPRPKLLSDYVNYLCSQRKPALNIRVEKKRLRLTDPPRMHGSATKLKKLGWKPKKKTEDALYELMVYWRHNN